MRSALAGTTGERPWLALLEVAKAAGAAAGERAQERMRGELELLPSKERKRYEREGLEARRRGERRARTRTLDLALRLAELWLRDVLCICEGAPELVLRGGPPRGARARRRGPSTARALRAAIELVGDTRLSLSLNVSEELALEALAYRLESTPLAGEAPPSRHCVTRYSERKGSRAASAGDRPEVRLESRRCRRPGTARTAGFRDRGSRRSRW